MTTALYSTAGLLYRIKQSEKQETMLDKMLFTLLHVGTHNINSPKFEAFSYWPNAIKFYSTYADIFDETPTFAELDELNNIIQSAREIINNQQPLK
jgi:hypothetical protein